MAHFYMAQDYTMMQVPEGPMVVPFISAWCGIIAACAELIGGQAGGYAFASLIAVSH